MKEFIVKDDFFKYLSLEDSKKVHDFFRECKYLNSKDCLTIRFFMYYMNDVIKLPNELEKDRQAIFKSILEFNLEEEDFMARKALYKKKPFGFKYED